MSPCRSASHTTILQIRGRRSRPNGREFDAARLGGGSGPLPSCFTDMAPIRFPPLAPDAKDAKDAIGASDDHRPKGKLHRRTASLHSLKRSLLPAWKARVRAITRRPVVPRRTLGNRNINHLGIKWRRRGRSLAPMKASGAMPFKARRWESHSVLQ
jgi:hypothetical protein